jgi:hypothetical protein
MMPALQFRFAHKFGKLSAGAKRGDSTQVYRGCAAGSGEISARGCAKRFILAALWFGLCRELSGEWSGGGPALSR